MTDDLGAIEGERAAAADAAEPAQPPAPTAAPDGRSLLAGVASTIATGASTIATGASSIAGGAGSALSAAAGPINSLASGARRIIDERPGARLRRVRRLGHAPLENLWERHPEARRASIRELGLIGVPVGQIRGTAVEGPAQRGGDFLPLKDRRSNDWRSRWQRILTAIDRLATLPPVELIKFGDGYWVVDGHNRVAAALYNGQVEIDAVVEELRLPGMRSEPATRIASVLEGSLDLRAAGTGRLTRTASRPDDRSGLGRDPARRRDPHADHGSPHDPDPSSSTEGA
jgi:hypothetical protein